MPKRHEARPTHGRSEQHLARRVQRLRTERGWSYETLAKAMTEAGCAITKAAVFAIEKGDPPRRITVDELLALSEVFGLELDDLLTPPELVDQRRAHELIDVIQRCSRTMGELAMDAFNAFGELLAIAEEDADLYEYVANHVSSGGHGSYTLSPLEEDDVVADVALLRMVKANSDHWEALQKAASMWHAYKTGHWTPDDDQKARDLLAELRAELAGAIEDVD